MVSYPKCNTCSVVSQKKKEKDIPKAGFQALGTEAQLQESRALEEGSQGRRGWAGPRGGLLHFHSRAILRDLNESQDLTGDSNHFPHCPKVGHQPIKARAVTSCLV